jgi:hypothetical protein
MPTQLQLYSWEYLHDVATKNGRKKIAVSSPLSWVLCYPSTYSLSMFRQVVGGGHERDQNHIAAFVLRACVMSLMFEKLPGLKTLFAGLRYSVETRKTPELGELPLVTISAPFPSFRPSDDIVLLASGVSGGNSFEEVLDLDTTRKMADPLRTQVENLLKSHGEIL